MNRRAILRLGTGLGLLGGAGLVGYQFWPPSPSRKLDAVKAVLPFCCSLEAVAEGPTFDQYWEDGSQLAGWGAVVGKYPDGTPAIVEGTFGGGWVILTGIHAEAPESWRHGMTFNTPATEDNSYAATLIQAALNRTSLSHF